MAFCKNCGNQLSDAALFCDKCGTAVENSDASAQQNYQQPGPQQYTGYQQPVQPEILSDEADCEVNKGIAWLSYIGPLFLIPLFAAKSSNYARYHVRQGATLCAAELAYAIVQAIMNAIMNALFRPELTWFGYRQHPIASIFGILMSIISVLFLVLAISGIVNAVSGKKEELPIIGNIDIIANLIDKIYDAICK